MRPQRRLRKPPVTDSNGRVGTYLPHAVSMAALQPRTTFCVSRPFRIRQFSPRLVGACPLSYPLVVPFILPCPRLPHPPRPSCRRQVGYLLGRAPGHQLPLPPHQMCAADRSDCRELLASLLLPRWLRPGQRLLFFFCHVPYIVFAPWSTYKDQV
jgi:hypothetical protein